MLLVVLRRIPQMIAVVFIVTVLAFSMINILPGDAVSAILGDQYTPEAAAVLTKELGLEQPILVRYFAWLWHLLQGDFGVSLATHVPVGQSMAQNALPTIELVVGALLVALILGGALAIASVVTRRVWVDQLANAAALVSTAMPNFILGLIATSVLGVKLHLIPTIGWVNPAYGGWGANLLANLTPCTVLGLTIFPAVMRIFRSELHEELETQEYVTAARLRGVTGWTLVWRHVARNASFGLVTVLAASIGLLISGAVILENVFAIPGIGTLLFQGIQLHDATVVVGCVTLIAFVVVLCNLAADLTYAVLDPRVRDAMNS